MDNQNNKKTSAKSTIKFMLVIVLASVIFFLCFSCVGIAGIWFMVKQTEKDDLFQTSTSQTESVELSAITADSEMLEDMFTGNIYQASDGSVIYFEEDGSFLWYQDDSDHSDNYYAGTFDVYLTDDAEDYIVNDLSDYGVTEEELAQYYERNAGSELYTKENFCCLVLHTVELFTGGQNQVVEPYDKNYMGFYSDGYYDAANMDSSQYAYFTLIE